MKQHIENSLLDIKFDDKCFNYLKDELKKEYNFELIKDLLSLPCMRFEENNKVKLMIALLEDGEINDFIIDTLCSHLIKISSTTWKENRGNLKELIRSKHFMFSKSQKLSLAHTIEIMFVKGYENSLEFANLIYQVISESDKDFNPDSDDNVRIKLAKLAYSTSKYNFNEKIAAINTIKHHLKSCGRKYLLGIVHYYKGLCLKIAGVKIGYNDDVHYIQKANLRGFALASMYLDYRANNLETSRES